jgi:FkbM family methyltransferase
MTIGSGPLRLRALLPLRVRRLCDDAVLVQRKGASRRPLRLDSLDGRTWVVRRGGRGRRKLVRVGPPELRTHLVVDQKAARADANLIQKGLSRYLVREQLAWIFRELEIDCVLDVGANKGQYARALRRAGYRGRIVSFEPVPRLVSRLRAASRDDPDWVVMAYGAGDEDTETEINVVRGTMSSVLTPSSFGEEWSATLRHRKQRTTTIQIRRLESLFDEATEGLTSPRVFLKLDTQGFDLRAFAGMGKRIEDVVGLQSEVACVPIYEGMPRMPEQLRTYEEAGFEVAGLFPVSRDAPTMRVIEFDVLMVRAEAVGVGRRTSG